MTQRYYPEWAELFSSCLSSLKGKRVVVQGHIRPDGDCIGSQVALCRCLQHLGVDAVAVNEHAVPYNLKAFVGDTPFYKAEDFLQDQNKAGTVINVDCADQKRVGEALYQWQTDCYANIDHHISNPLYAKHNFIDAQSAATCSILATLFFDCGWPIDAVTAQALYVGIATDTGQFCFSNTNAQTFALCQRLIECGADPATAAKELYERESINKLNLLQHFLKSFQMECDNRVCVGTLPDGIYRETGSTGEDAEGFVDYTRCIDGVEIGVLLEERSGKIKGSFRATDKIHRVDEIAKQFNGGGHASAAGFNVDAKLEEFYPKVIAALEKHFSTLTRSE